MCCMNYKFWQDGLPQAWQCMGCVVGTWEGVTGFSIKRLSQKLMNNIIVNVIYFMHVLLLQIIVDLIPSYFPQPRPACGSTWIGFVCSEWWEIHGHVCCSWSNRYPSWWTTIASETSENTSFLLDWVQKCGSGTLMDTCMTQTQTSSFVTFDSQSMVFLVGCTNGSH